MLLWLGSEPCAGCQVVQVAGGLLGVAEHSATLRLALSLERLLLQPWPGAMSVKELSAHILRDLETVLSRVKLFAALG